MPTSTSLLVKSFTRPLFFGFLSMSLLACGGSDDDNNQTFSPVVTPEPSDSVTPDLETEASPAPESETPVPEEPGPEEPAPDPGIADGSCTEAVFCFDFENTETLPAALSASGKVAISGERAFAGDSSIKVSAQGAGYNRNFLSLNLEESQLAGKMYGRMMVWVDDPGGNGGDFTFVQADGKAASSSAAPKDTNVFYRYRVAGTARPGTVMANYDTQVDPESSESDLSWATDCWDHSDKILPREAWACVEWYFDANNNELKYWLNGEEVEDIHVLGQGEGCINNETQGGEWLAPESFKSLHLGVEQYHNGVPPRTMFIDDVRVDTEYVGCPDGDYLNTPIDTVESPEDFVPGPDGNLISSDGTFSSGQKGFVGFFNVAGSGSVSWENEAAFTISAETEQAWHIQIQHLVNLDEGSEYTLCFDAKAEAKRSIEYDIDLGGDPWSSVIGEATTITLGTEYQAFSKTFTALADDDASRLVISLGLEAVSVSIDNIGVFEGSSCRELSGP